MNNEQTPEQKKVIEKAIRIAFNRGSDWQAAEPNTPEKATDEDFTVDDVMLWLADQPAAQPVAPEQAPSIDALRKAWEDGYGNGHGNGYSTGVNIYEATDFPVGNTFEDYIARLASLSAKGEAPKEDAAEWWCAHCQITVDPRNVTFEERHDKCGCLVSAPIESDARTIEVNFDGNVLAKIEVSGTFTVLAAMDGWGKAIEVDKITVAPAPEGTVSAPQNREGQPFEKYPALSAAIEYGANNWRINTGWTELLQEINATITKLEAAAPSGVVEALPATWGAESIIRYLKEVESYFDFNGYQAWTHWRIAIAQAIAALSAAPKEGEQPEPISEGAKVRHSVTGQVGTVKKVLDAEYAQVDFGEGTFSNGRTAIKNLALAAPKPNPEPLVAALRAVRSELEREALGLTYEGAGDYDKGVRRGLLSAVDQLDPILTQWEASQPSPWIAVTPTTMPTEADAFGPLKICLVVMVYGHYRDSGIMKVREAIFTFKEGYFSDNIGVIEASHWMPLPAPPSNPSTPKYLNRGR